jgi:hypothetical protein
MNVSLFRRCGPPSILRTEPAGKYCDWYPQAKHKATDLTGRESRAI